MTGTFTPRLNLYKPDGTPITGDLVDVVADLNNNFDKIDGAVQAVATSSTRPTSSVFVGMLVYETDTKAIVVALTASPSATWRYLTVPIVTSLGSLSPVHTHMQAINSTDLKLYKYNGSAWIPQFNGILSTTAILNSTNNTTTEIVQPEQCSNVPVITGRTYEVTHTRNEAYSGSANNRFNKYRVTSSGTLTTSSTQFDETFVNGLTGGYNTYQFIATWVATFTGNAIFGLSSFMNTGTGLVDSARKRVLIVKDITPSSQ